MKTYTETRREGEYLGPIDWAGRDAWCVQLDDQQVGWLRAIEEKPEEYEVTTDGGWPRVGWRRVIRVGMYDGWPYWKPGPALLVSGMFGSEWYWAGSLTGAARRGPRSA